MSTSTNYACAAEARHRITRALPSESKVIAVGVLTRLLAMALSIVQLYEVASRTPAESSTKPLVRLLRNQWQEQTEAVEAIVDRIQALGGAALASTFEVHLEDELALGLVARTPNVSPDDLFAAQGAIVERASGLLHRVKSIGDVDTKELIVDRIIRLNELQRWSLSTHLTKRDER